jgi:hypothetical protein
MTFKEWRASLNGADAFNLMNRYGDVRGGKLSHKSGGVYTWGKDSVDLTGHVPDVNSDSASQEAFLYLKYLKVARKKGFNPGPFEYLGEDEDED